MIAIDFANLLHWHEYTKLLIGLLAIMGDIALPVFIALHPTGPINEKRKMALVSVSIAVVVLVSVAFVGGGILGFFGITVAAFKVAGGIILLRAAFNMVSSDGEANPDASPSRSWLSLAVVPLAFPTMAGPGSIATVIVFSQLHVGLEHILVVALCVLSAGLLILGMLWFAPWISRVMGPTGIIVFSRIMGLLVASIAVEYILDGVALHFPEIFQFEGHGD